jgi:hypothetical protein
MATVTNRKLSVNYRRQEYDCYYGTWRKIRDAITGQIAIKDDTEGRRTTYLPPLSGHLKADGSSTNKNYDTYTEYAEWYAASSRTVNGLVGLVFRKEPQVEKPNAMEPYFEDLTLDGQNAINFSKELLTEVISVNRVGVLLDIPTAATEGLTQEQIEAQNVRPYARIYKTEAIINWKEEVINNVKKTSLVVLDEDADGEFCDDYFVENTVKQYRVLKLVPVLDTELGTSRYVYTQIIYQELDVNDSTKTDKDKQWQEVDRKVPLVNGEPLDYIPFIVINDTGNNWDINTSIVDGLIDVNIGHYRNSANLENALIWTGNPTPWVSGLIDNNDSDTINLGSTECIKLEGGGQAGYMEFTGQGISPIREAMEDKEKRMALLGARIIASDKKSGETAETATIHRAGEQGVLATIANVVSMSMTVIFRIIQDWKGINGDTVLILNTDYVPIEMGAADMVGLLQMYQAGAISMEVLRWNLKKGERIPNALSSDDLDKQIEENPPPEGAEPKVDDEIPEVPDEVMNDEEEEDNNEGNN